MKTTLSIDSSCLDSLQCPYKFFLQVVKGYVPIGGGLSKNFKVAYGTAFHRFIANWYKTKDVDASIEIARKSYEPIIVPDKDFRTMTHLTDVCLGYLEAWKDDYLTPLRLRDGSPLVELGFKFPIYSDPDLDIVLFGKIDEVCKMDDMIIVKDHKTTAAFDPASYFEGYLLSPQMLLYCWVLSKMSDMLALDPGFRNPKFVVDGIFLQKAVLKKGTQAPARYLRSNIIEPAEKLGMFWNLLTVQCMTIADWVKNGYVKSGILNKACAGKWGSPCDYHRVCEAHSYDDAMLTLNGDFEFQPYDETRLVESE